MNETRPTTTSTKLRIYQINVNRSPNAQADIIHLSPKDWDIICIQEPYFDWQGLSRVTNGWTPVYPYKHKNGVKSRSIMLISSLLSTDAWEALPVDSIDISAIKISGDFGHIRLFNLYNACEHSNTTDALAKYLSESAVRADTSIPVYDIWTGDFNRHDPMWEDPKFKQLFTRRHLDDAEILINLLADYSMEMALPPGIPTLEHMVSKELHRVDHVFVSAELSDYIISCDTLKHRPPKTDHYPITTVVDLDIAHTLPSPSHNFRATDWPEFRKGLQQRMDRLKLHDPRNPDEFEAILDDVMEAIQGTIEEHVPMTRPSAYMKRWWSKELTQMRSHSRSLGKKSFHVRTSDPTHPVHEEYQRARNDYADLISSSKKDCWENFYVSAEEKSMYIINKFVTMEPSDGGKTRIPTLKVKQEDGTIREVSDNEGKGEALYNVFFTPPPPINHVPDYVYPKPPEAFKNISDTQIRRIIKKLSPYKAPGPDGVSNSVYTHCADILVPWLGKMFRATFRLKYYPPRWQVYDTIVLRKPGKPDYSLAKAYRPIALLITMAKILTACVAENVSYIAEKHQLLPSRHFGGRPGRTTTDSLHHLIKWIRDSLRKGMVVSALFLDVSGAFPNTNIPMLLHDMKKRGIPEEYTDWLARRLDGRRTILHFDGYKSIMREVNNGLEQGCSGSPLWYLFSNADTIEDSIFTANTTGAAFIDDTYYAARAKTPEESNAMLERIMTEPGGALDWAKTHHACFELDKNALMIFSNKRVPDPARPGKTIPAPRPSITINGHTNIPVASTKFLGLILDQNLTFKQHADYAAAKGRFWINQTKRISKTVKGMQGVYSRRLYLTVCVPRMLYGASIWLNPIRRAPNTRTRGSAGSAAALARVQRTAALHITGGMRTSPTDLLNAHADLLPMELLIDKWCHREALRLASLPATHPLYRSILNASKRLPKRLPSPMHNVLNAFNIQPQRMEKIQAFRHGTRWKSRYTISIAASKEAAIEEEAKDRSEVKIFTDGSGFQKNIGAAAVLFRGRQTRTLRYRLGEDTEHTVFEGEVVGSGLGTELLRTERKVVRTATMFIDNQASIKSTQSFRSTPGHYLTDHLNRQMMRVFKRHPNLRLKICWIPGHCDVAGNEAVDIEAKKAATEGSSPDIHLPVLFRSKKPLPLSKSATKQAYAADLKVRSSVMLSKSPRYASICRIDNTTPSNKYQKLVQKLARPQASIIAQLRMGHAPLNKHLHRLKCADSPICGACGMEEETVIHYLIMCPAYERHRAPLRATFGIDAKSIQFLLTDRKALKYLLRYMGATRRFKAEFGELAPPPKASKKKKKKT